ncbi:MAG: hypothetical protein ACRDJU_06005 [Actinomycetota bacterium]
MRERIVEAAGAAFAERGYAGVHLGELAIGLGLARDRLMSFYPNKPLLAREVVGRHARNWESLAGSELDPEGRLLDEIEALTYRLAYSYQVDALAQGGTRLSAERPVVPGELPRPALAWLLQRLSALLAEAQRRGEVKPCIDPPRVAGVIVAFFHGAHAVSQHPAVQQDLAGCLERFWAMARPFLRVEAPT